jgi:UDP-N-acetylmuramoyl-tripeptide--D-alanyl-D-alanine ligase
VATALGGVRWLRVAQREHYLPDSASRFVLRWWRTTPANVLGVLVGLAGLVLAARWTGAAFGSAAAVALGPLGLGLRGRTSPLAWWACSPGSQLSCVRPARSRFLRSWTWPAR